MGGVQSRCSLSSGQMEIGTRGSVAWGRIVINSGNAQVSKVAMLKSFQGMMEMTVLLQR